MDLKSSLGELARDVLKGREHRLAGSLQVPFEGLRG